MPYLALSLHFPCGKLRLSPDRRAQLQVCDTRSSVGSKTLYHSVLGARRERGAQAQAQAQAPLPHVPQLPLQGQQLPGNLSAPDGPLPVPHIAPSPEPHVLET